MAQRLIDANKIEYENIYVYPTDSRNYKECVGRSAKIREAETVLTIPDNPTNGDMIKALFPDIEVRRDGVVVAVNGLDSNKKALFSERCFWTDWWNAPYNKDSK